jgi:hypothetical protein
MVSTNVLRSYYAATALFATLDFGFDINVRAAFLESTPGLRLLFYGALFVCFALTLRRPEWSTLIGTVESLVTLVALIVNMAMRSMVITDEMIETGAGFITMSEIVNFLIAGGAAYISYVQGFRKLAGKDRPGPL